MSAVDVSASPPPIAYVDKSLAQAVARTHIEKWAEAGDHAAKEFDDILDLCRLATLHGPKHVRRAVEEAALAIRGLLRRANLPGEVFEPQSGRQYEAVCVVPMSSESSVGFQLVRCLLNSRSGAVDLQHGLVLRASLHVTQRLFQRLGTLDGAAVLAEIYPSISNAIALRNAANVVGAQHWPVLTPKGLFVAAPLVGDDRGSALITWMRSDQLGPRWQRIESALRTAHAQNPRIWQNKAFIQELLRLHSWLLNPYESKEAELRRWWASRSQGPNATQGDGHEAEDDSNAVEAALSSSEQDDETEGDLAASSALQDSQATQELLLDEARDEDDAQASGDGLAETATSDATESGANVEAGKGSSGRLKHHRLKRHHKVHEAILVQQRNSRAWTVGLRNGYFGVLPVRAGVEDNPPGARVQPLTLGATVAVEIQHVFSRVYEGPGTLLLALKEEADARWEGVKKNLALGTIVEARVLAIYSHSCLLLAPGGVIGRLRKQDVDWRPKNSPDSFRELTVGQVVRAAVTAHVDAERRLTLSMRHAKQHPLANRDLEGLVGTVMEGTATVTRDFGVFVHLPIGADALLHRDNMPIGFKAATGQRLRVRIITCDTARLRIGLELMYDNEMVEPLLGRVINAKTMMVDTDGAHFRLAGTGLRGVMRPALLPAAIQHKVGHWMSVRITGLDGAANRLCLQMPIEPHEVAQALETEYEARIVRPMGQSFFVLLDTGISALVPMTGLPPDFKPLPNARFRVRLRTIDLDNARYVATWVGHPPKIR